MCRDGRKAQWHIHPTDDPELFKMVCSKCGEVRNMQREYWKHDPPVNQKKVNNE